MSHFSNIVSRAQQLLSEVLLPGDLAVDLTAGNGFDTLFLAETVGPAGRVLAFDVQEQAIANTTELLQQSGVILQRLDISTPELYEPGVTLVGVSHDRLSGFLDEAPKGIIANLGYLPGGDEVISTRKDSTVVALRHAAKLLAEGGRIAVVVYPGHPGGQEEGDAVDALFAALPLKRWQVLRISVPNSNAAPYLVVAEKKH